MPRVLEKYRIANKNIAPAVTSNSAISFIVSVINSSELLKCFSKKNFNFDEKTRFLIVQFE